MADRIGDGYEFNSAKLGHSHGFLLPSVGPMLKQVTPAGSRIFDLGCGNGAVAAYFAAAGYVPSGCDISDSGIAHAQKVHSGLDLHQASVYDPLADRFGTFPLVYSLEVVEHLYDPRLYARTLCDLIAPGGHGIISTPYHGYLKNLALALTGKMESHFTALWDNGHIKFWSIKTLTQLMTEVGLEVVKIDRVGRIPALGKSMVMLVRKP